MLVQKFARASESLEQKRAFLADFNNRRFGRCFLMLCGETNIIRTRMPHYDAHDEFGLMPHLKRSNVAIILNPGHDYMRRHEMKKKRAALSSPDRWVLSVWNMGKASEAHQPWTAFRDGHDLTSNIREVSTGSNDVRVGLISIPLQM